jgi:ribonuclease HII
LAGPVVAAGVVFSRNDPFPHLADSKTLTFQKRERLFDQITRASHVSYSIAFSTVDEIDELNILKATFLAMRRVLETLSVTPDAVLVDGDSRIDEVGAFQRTVVKGDALSFSIAAASILAKVTRDRWITEKAREYPCYEFENHKGYGTKKHLLLLNKFGPCPLHRKSFSPVRTLLGRDGAIGDNNGRII